MAAKPEVDAATKRPTAKLAPLGRSTAQNRVPSTSRNVEVAPTKPRSGLSRTTTQREEEREEPVVSPTERAKEAMKVVNSALATLSGLNKAGFRAKSASGSPTAASSGVTPFASATRPGSAASLRATTSTSSLRTTAAHSATLTKATQAVRDCSRALKELRTLAADGILGKKKVDVERAAGSIVANLVEMEMYRPAVVELAAMRSSLLSWWTSPPSRPTLSPSAPLASFADTLLFPLPSDAFFAPNSLEETLDPLSARPPFADLVPLVLASQQYLLACLFRSDEEDAGSPKDKLANLAEFLQKGTGGPLNWRRAVDCWITDEQEKAMLVKRLDAMMTSMFGTVTKGCTGVDGSAVPDDLLIVRTHALLLYSSTSALSSANADKLSAFHDQVRKTVLLYGRAAEQARYTEVRIGNGVKEAFESIVAELKRRGLVEIGKDGGAKWRELCEVVLHIARRADDLAFVERISTLLGAENGSSAGPTDVHPDLLSSQICAKLASVLSVFEIWVKTSGADDRGVVDQMRRLSGLLPVLTKLRCAATAEGGRAPSNDSKTKIDKTVDRLRYVFAKHVKAGKRMDQLLTPADAIPPPVDEVTVLAKVALDRLAHHAEQILAANAIEGKNRSYLAATTVDTLLLLAYSSLIVDDRSTALPCLAFLERCLPLVGFSPSTILALDLHYSIRTLTSACYNIGGTLFNAARPELAVNFVQRACDLSAKVLDQARSDDLLPSSSGADHDELSSQLDSLKLATGEVGKEEKELREAQQDFERLMSRRWELLAMTRYAMGDKRAAYDAYVAAVHAQPSAVFAPLATAASRQSLSEILSTHHSLYKQVERLTRLSTYDLLLPPALVPLSSSPTLSSTLSRDVRGVLLEMQLAVLEAQTDSREGRCAAAALLEQLLAIYHADETPVRRARVLVKSLQHSCAGRDRDSETHARALADEIANLCAKENLQDDDALRPLAAQYNALSHLFLAFRLQAIRTASADASDAIASEARQALQVLRGVLDGDSKCATHRPSNSPRRSRQTAASPAKPTSPPQPTPAPTRRRPARIAASAATPARSRLGRSQRGAAPASTSPQVTPPRRTSVAVDLRESTRTPAPKKLVPSGVDKLVALDGADSVYKSFESMASLLGVLGQALLKIGYLKFLRQLAERLEEGGNAYVIASITLAREYLRLGKTSRAGLVLAQAESRVQSAARDEQPVAVDAHVSYLLVNAEYLATLGNHDRSAQAYEAALSLADELASATAASATARVVERTLLLQRASMAAITCSYLLQRKGELSRALPPAIQAMRLATRAVNNLSRLASSPKPATPSAAESTFTAPLTDHVTPLADAPPINERKTSTTIPSGIHAGLSWRLLELLLATIERVALVHFVRGTPKSADYFAQQALDFAEDVGSANGMARALLLRADVRLQWGKQAEAAADLDRVSQLLRSSSTPEAAELLRLQGDLHLRENMRREAQELYLDANRVLDTFIASASDGDAGQSPVKHHTPVQNGSAGRRRVSGPSVHFAHLSPSPIASKASPAGDWVLPAVQCRLLRMQAHLLAPQSKNDELTRLLRRIARLASHEEEKADELRLVVALKLRELLARCSSDPVLGMLPDSVLSLPVFGISATGAAPKVGTPRTGPTVVNIVKDIDNLLARAVNFSVSRASAKKVRELSLLSASVRAMQASVGKSTKRSTATIAHLLDLGVAVSLRREMAEAVEQRLDRAIRRDDMTWPSLDLAPVPTSEDIDEHLLKTRDRYRLEAAEPILTEQSISTLLSPAWSVLTLHLTPEHDALIISRHRHADEPIVFKLPLDRLARREGEEEDAFTFDVAMIELQDIVERNNTGAQNAKLVDGKEQRAAWWAERKELDQRLGDLLQTVEDAWLGAFKSVFYDARLHSGEAFASFRSRIERILKRSIVRAAGDQRATRFKLDDAILECLAALPATSREEDLEDMFYYMAESFQFSGVPLASDETDVDQVVVDLREALEELHGTKSAPKSKASPDEHTFLILDKRLQAFPWESLPCIRGRSVSRLPSLSFLRDRLDLAADRSPETPHDFVVDHARTSYLINPGGDLKNTQQTFEPWLREQADRHGWTGVVARTPLEEEVKQGLTSKELFLFFGHGGAEQYIRSQTIRQLPRCAVTMLWGCSSGMLKDQGDFDPVGTPYHYMVGGCPSLVANLWDVTDKDIDKFAFSVFRKTGIAEPETASPPPSPPLSLTAAVAQSRDVCNLRYLNGAAPVVYGIPVRFALSQSQV
ncbi:separin protein [Rhodotorula toruloides]